MGECTPIIVKRILAELKAAWAGVMPEASFVTVRAPVAASNFERY